MFDFYTSCMNVKYIENSDLRLIHNLLKIYISTPINANWTLERILGRVLTNFGDGVFLDCGVRRVPYDTSRNKFAVSVY